jgi:hypothetical protein
MGVEVFRVPLYRRYLADRLTCGYCLALFFWFTVIVLPFFMAYTSESFWMKRNTYREMPKVSFKYQVLVHAGISSTSAPDIQKITYALRPETAAILESTYRVPKLRFWDEDSNNDGFPELMQLEMELPLKSTEQIHSIDAIAVFQMELSMRSKLKFEAPILIQHESPFRGESLYVDGMMDFVQREALHVRGGFKTPDSGTPLLGLQKPSNPKKGFVKVPKYSIHDVSMKTLLGEIQKRNFTTYYTNALKTWSPRPEASTPVNLDSSYSRPFKLHAVIHVPEQVITYIPSLSEMLKFGFIQYLSMAFIVYLISWYAIEFVFTYQVVDTTSRLDTQYYGPKVHKF